MTLILAAAVSLLGLAAAAQTMRLRHTRKQLRVTRAALEQARAGVRETEHFLGVVDAQFFKDQP